MEDTVGGTVALGRAANYVRVNDFMAVWQNPANLALVPGRDAGLELRLPIFNACFDRVRNPEPEYKPTESFDKVCNEAKLFPTGNIGYAQSFRNGLGFGVGVYTPAAIAKLRFGDDTIITSRPFPDERYDITTTGEESANRYLLLSREVIAAFLMAGVGYQIIPELRVGLSAGFGFVSINYQNVASIQGGTFLDQEVLTEIHARDWFVPRATFSVVGKPIPALELMAQVTVQADIVANGYLDARANGITGAPRGDCRDQDPGTFCRVDDVTLRVPYQSVELYLGARYAQKRPGAEERITLDPMRDELWDVELDLYFANTSNVGDYRLNLYDVAPSSPQAARIDFTSDPAGAPSPLPPQAVIPHQWRNTYGVRLGGEYHVLQKFLSLRAGLSYESRAMRQPYMNIDYFPVNKVGLHFGATMAFGITRVSIAYAHLFYEQMEVPVGTGRVPEVVAVDRAEALPVNEGSYSARADILSFQVNVRF